MSKLIMLRGNSGCGKSTIARLLQHELGRGTLMIPQDTVRRELLWVNDRPDNPAVRLMENLLRYGFSQCEYVILEGILYADYYKSLFDRAKSLFGSNIHAYYFDIPFAETVARHQGKPNAHEFGEAQMRSWWREKDLLPDIEEQMITIDMTKEDIIARILRDIGANR